MKIKVGPGLETEKTLPAWRREKGGWKERETGTPAVEAGPAFAPRALSLITV